VKKNRVRLAILILALNGIVTATETAYQWTDGQGQIHYGDKRPVSVKSRIITLQQGTDNPIGLRPGERNRLDQMELRQRQQQHRTHTARTRADQQRAAARARCADSREMYKSSRGRDAFKKHSRYLRNNCW
jgi:hypothetical protein